MSTTLSEKLHILSRIQDLDVMISEARDPARKKDEEGMGFRLESIEKLTAARQKLSEKIGPRDLRLYERIAKKHLHVVVQVSDQTCLGCFMALPTQTASLRATDPDQLLTCENCGRILYWPD